MRVIFGGQTIKAFVASPRHLKVLGIVRMDLEYGLLAVDADGRYLRVNGSQTETLNDTAIRAAINRARTTSRSDPFEDTDSEFPMDACEIGPKVIVRKRRRIGSLLSGMTHQPGFAA